MERGEQIEMSDRSPLVRHSSMERLDFIPQVNYAEVDHGIGTAIQFRKKDHLVSYASTIETY
jgi:hypothetical protein